MDNKNFLAAVALSILILVGFHYLYEKPKMEVYQQQLALQKLNPAPAKPEIVPPAPVVLRDRATILAESSRVSIETPEVRGSISLKGARLDDLSLINYRETVEPNSPQIVLLSPAGSAAPHQADYAEFGWLGSDVVVPDSSTVWRADQKTLTPAKPVTLTWDNGHGLAFERTVAIDDHFMFTITDRVKNSGKDSVTLYPFGLVARHGKPQTSDIYIMHEGPIGILGGRLQEHKYKDMMATPKIVTDSDGGWLGITDKYWLVALAPSQDEKVAASFSYDRGTDANPEQGVFQTDFRGTPISLAAGASTEHTQHFFAGAKRLRLLDDYATRYDIPKLYDAIDFGWFYFLTKPFLYLLDILGNLFGNVGLAILAFTILLKFVTFPLSMKSYRSMAKMKILQPEIKALQERFKDDKQRMSVEMMELYKREKTNPMSGCLPNLIQIPIFFALYKVLYVGIEMRQAPFYGWIHDLSAPDPTSVLTLFGTIPWEFIPHIGVWPVLMGLSMFLQQRLSPQPPDKTQAQIFMFLPIMFTFMMSSIAAGLIIYWTWSNLLGIAQQWFIMRKMGVKRA